MEPYSLHPKSAEQVRDLLGIEADQPLTLGHLALAAEVEAGKARGRVITCKSTRYGPGCGHPVEDHRGGECCCCNGSHNNPIHVVACPRCRPIVRAYLLRQYGDEPIPPEYREPGDKGWPVKTHPLTGEIN